METNNRIIIIGGGPAGSTTASYLAKKGHDVLVIEKEKFPRPHVGESLIPFTHDMFKELGLLDEMEAKYNRKPGVKFTSSDGAQSTVWYFDKIIDGPSSLSFHVERAPFDKLLLDKSVEWGAEVMEESTVTDIDFDLPDNMSCVTVTDKSGNMSKHYARFVVDASGQSTFLANKFNDKTNYEGLNRVALNTHWFNPNYSAELAEGCIEIIHLGGEKLGWIWAIPLSADWLSVGVVMSADHFKAQRKKYKGDPDMLEKIYHGELAESAAISAILKDAKQDERVNAHGDYSYYTENKYGNNYAVVGDASAFLDPIFSSGIYVGMVSGKLVSEQIDKLLREGLAPDETLGRAYENIKGGYDLVEKLIRTFYDPNAISLSSLNNVKDVDYEKFHKAYTIYHYILAGDFFSNPTKYDKVIDMLKDSDKLEKFRNFIYSKEKAAV